MKLKPFIEYIIKVEEEILVMDFCSWFQEFADPGITNKIGSLLLKSCNKYLKVSSAKPGINDMVYG